MLNFIRLRVPDDAIAQDLTAATFEQAFRKIDQLRNQDAFAGWLFRIARNEVGQYYRRQRPQTDLDSLLELASHQESPFEAATAPRAARRGVACRGTPAGARPGDHRAEVRR